MVTAQRPSLPFGGPDSLYAWVVALSASAAVILDQATKHLALAYLREGRMVDWIADGWGWQLTFNDGGAFGVDAPSLFFLAVTVIVTVIVVRQTPELDSARAGWAYGLLLAGAWGNALDRVFRAGDPGDPRFLYGHVVDFVALGAWPRFNVADVVIGVGFGLLVLQLWAEERAGEA